MLHPSFHARQRPDKPAWVLWPSLEQQTYGEMEAEANRVAHWFKTIGLQIGDGVAVLLNNHPRFLPLYWGCQRAGLYFTPISTQFQSREIAHILSDCDAKVFITGVSQLPKLESIAGAVATVPNRLLIGADPNAAPHPLFDDYEHAIGAASDQPLAGACEGADMLYSSGTTGNPKGVRNSAPGAPLGTVSELFTRRLEWHQLTTDTVFLSTAPLYHSAPLRYCAMTARIGGTAIVMERFDAEQALAVIERFKVTHSQWVPTMLVRMLRLTEEVRHRYDLSSHHFAIHAAAPCPIPVKEQMLTWWGPIVYEYYSGTEGNGQTVIGPEEWLAHKGSVGRPLHGIVRILDATGRACAPGEEGKVWFEGGSAFEYYKDPDKTASTRNANGWSTLGDVGRLDDDGYLYLTDRESFMIISGGVNIYPLEVENVLIEHPAVADVAVFGVPHEEFGEQVKAAVELSGGYQGSERLTSELIGYCRERLAHLKCPRSIDYHVKLPRHDTGKLYKKVLRDPYWA